MISNIDNDSNQLKMASNEIHLFSQKSETGSKLVDYEKLQN